MSLLEEARKASRSIVYNSLREPRPPNQRRLSLYTASDVVCEPISADYIPDFMEGIDTRLVSEIR